jgi:hypothetical protein
VADACVIVMGWDTSTTLDLAVVSNLAGATTVATCNPCANTQRVTFPSTASGFTTSFSGSPELKPVETHVLLFGDVVDAKVWLDTNAHRLTGKQVHMISPAVMTVSP